MVGGLLEMEVEVGVEVLELIVGEQSVSFVSVVLVRCLEGGLLLLLMSSTGGDGWDGMGWDEMGLVCCGRYGRVARGAIYAILASMWALRFSDKDKEGVVDGG